MKLALRLCLIALAVTSLPAQAQIDDITRYNLRPLLQLLVDSGEPWHPRAALALWLAVHAAFPLRRLFARGAPRLPGAGALRLPHWKLALGLPETTGLSALGVAP